MKKYTCFALLALLILVILLPGCTKKDINHNGEDDPMPGGYTGDRELTDEDWAIFNEAVDLDGVSYTPTLVATQVVAGINYRFTTTATPVVPEPESYTAYVYIFKPIGDDPPELVDITRTKKEQSK